MEIFYGTLQHKTPKKEIELAKLRKADYIGRMMNK